jgi:twinkle protein
MPQTGKDENCICFPYIRDGSLVNIKFRDGQKNFKMVTDAEKILFGMQFIKEKKHIIIVEGEIDCLTLADCGYGVDPKNKIQKIDTDSGDIQEEDPDEKYYRWCPTSVPNGASDQKNNLDYIENCFNELNGIHEFIIATDDDPAGRLLKEELIRRLGVNRCSVIEYPKQEVVPLEGNLKRKCKDLNEVRKYLGVDAVHKCIQEAKAIPIEGVHYLKDWYPIMLENFRKGLTLGSTTRMGPEMDQHFRWKIGDLNLGIGYGNHGKTTFQNQMELAKAIYDDWKFAVFCPENFPATDFYDDLVEPFVGKHLQAMTDEEYEFACRFIGEHFFYVYPEDEHTIFNIHERFRHLIMKKGINGCRIDPWNQLDKEFTRFGMTNEERLSIDLKASKRFSLENGVCYSILAHPKNPEYLDKKTKQLPIVDMYDIAGGAQWGNKIDNIWSYYRPNWHIDKEDPTVEIHFQKIKRKRTGGKLGWVELTHDWKTKRYTIFDGSNPCDPARAEKILRMENYDQGIQSSVFYDDPALPDVVSDEPTDDLPF